MNIALNGCPHAVPAGTTVRGLLAVLEVRPEVVAVERNRVLVRRRDHEATVLAEGDAVEIVTLVGGG